MHIPPPQGSMIHQLKPILAAKQLEDLSPTTDVTEVVRDKRIGDVFLQYFRSKPITGFDASGTADDFNFYAQLSKYSQTALMYPFLKRPHITVVAERVDGQGIRAISINPEDYSFGPLKDIKLAPSQHSALIEVLDEHFEDINVMNLLYEQDPL